MDRSALIRLAVVLLLGTAALAAEPPKPVFDVFRYGAKGDGQTNDQAALQRAIDACGGTGGSVYVHDGRFLTGQITLRSRLTLFIGPSATLLGIRSNGQEDYPSAPAPFPSHINGACQRRLIYGQGLTAVAIAGGGLIDGQGDYAPWINRPAKVEEKNRPSLIELARCDGVRIADVRLARPGMWTQVYLECTHLRLQNLNVDTGNIPGTRDGMDICDCSDVQIAHCRIRSQDDGICFKSGSPAGCHRIEVSDCYVDKLGLSAGNCLKFGTASQGALTDVVCRNLVLTNTLNSAITWESVDGAKIARVVVRDCQVTRAGQVLAVILGHRRGQVGSISDLTFENISASHLMKPIGCIVTGIPGHPIENVRFVGLRFQLPGGVAQVPASVREYAGEYPEGTHFGDLPGFALFLRHVRGATVSGCTFSTDRPDVRPAVVTEDVVERIVPMR